jgi:hypothetical protein
MTWIFQGILPHVVSFQAFLVLLFPVAYLIWKRRKRQEEKFYEAVYRRERITRRIMES